MYKINKYGKNDAWEKIKKMILMVEDFRLVFMKSLLKSVSRTGWLWRQNNEGDWRK